MHKLIEPIWKQNKMPDEWNTGIISPIQKNGNNELCENYKQ